MKYKDDTYITCLYILIKVYGEVKININELNYCLLL